jgi:hypothetical protein
VGESAAEDVPKVIVDSTLKISVGLVYRFPREMEQWERWDLLSDERVGERY